MVGRPEGNQPVDDFWMAEVLREAEANLAHGELPLAAIVVAGDSEISRARSCDFASANRSSHAELLAITRARFAGLRDRELTLYASLEPCVMCAAAVLIEGFDKVVYALQAPEDGGTFLFDDELVRARCLAAKRPRVVTGIHAVEAAAQFADYIRLWPDHKGMSDFARAVLSTVHTGSDGRSRDR